MAAAITDAAQPNLVEIWGLVFVVIATMAVAAKAVNPEWGQFRPEYDDTMTMERRPTRQR